MAKGLAGRMYVIIPHPQWCLESVMPHLWALGMKCSTDLSETISTMYRSVFWGVVGIPHKTGSHPRTRTVMKSTIYGEN